MFFNEVLFGFKKVDQLFEILKLHLIIDNLQPKHLQNLFVDQFEGKRADAEESVDDNCYFLLFLDSECLLSDFHHGNDYLIDKREGTREHGTIHIGIVDEGFGAKKDVHMLDQIANVGVFDLLFIFLSKVDLKTKVPTVR